MVLLWEQAPQCFLGKREKGFNIPKADPMLRSAGPWRRAFSRASVVSFSDEAGAVHTAHSSPTVLKAQTWWNPESVASLLLPVFREGYRTTK